MIYLWRNCQDRRVKMGSRTVLREEYINSPDGTINVLAVMSPTQVDLAKNILKQFGEINRPSRAA